MNYKSILLLLSLCSTNVHAFDVVAEYSIESADHLNQLNCKRNMSIIDTAGELFDSIIDGVSNIQSRSCSRSRSEESEMLYFVTCSVTKDNQTRGFASVLSSYDIGHACNNRSVTRNSIGSPILCSTNLSNLKENLSRICDDIKVDYTYTRAFSPFAN